MPDVGDLPEGALRDLVADLHMLYRDAGFPGVRVIAADSRRRDDLRDVVSHEGAATILRGTGVPRWSKLETVVRILASRAVSHPNPDEVVREFHEKWLAAYGAPTADAKYSQSEHAHNVGDSQEAHHYAISESRVARDQTPSIKATESEGVPSRAPVEDKERSSDLNLKQQGQYASKSRKARRMSNEELDFLITEAERIIGLLPEDLRENLSAYSQYLWAHDMLPSMDYFVERPFGLMNWTRQARLEWVNLVASNGIFESTEPDSEWTEFSDVGLMVLHKI